MIRLIAAMLLASCLYGQEVGEGSIVLTEESQTLLNKFIDGDNNVVRLRRLSSGCTSLTDGYDGEPCWDKTAETLYICKTTDSICDTSGEWIAVSGAGGGYATVQDEGSGVTQRTILNFAGSGVTCVDDTTKTTCTISGAGTQYHNFVSGRCQSGTAYGSAILPTSNPATLNETCVNITEAEYTFADAATNCVADSLRIRGTAPSSVTFDVEWRTAATSGNGYFSFEAVCYGNDEARGTITYGAAANSAFTASGTTNQISHDSSSAYSVTCSDNEDLFWQVCRLGSNASDTLDGSSLGVLSVRVRY